MICYYNKEPGVADIDEECNRDAPYVPTCGHGLIGSMLKLWAGREEHSRQS